MFLFSNLRKYFCIHFNLIFVEEYREHTNEELQDSAWAAKKYVLAIEEVYENDGFYFVQSEASAHIANFIKGQRVSQKCSSEFPQKIPRRRHSVYYDHDRPARSRSPSSNHYDGGFRPRSRSNYRRSPSPRPTTS